MRAFINDLKGRLNTYTQLVQESEAKGFYGASFDEIETHGTHIGKKEMLEEIIPKLESLYKLMK